MSCASSGGSVYVRVVLTLCKCIRVLCLISSGKAEQYNFLVISGVTALPKADSFQCGAAHRYVFCVLQGMLHKCMCVI